jgi:hypothetical protein
MDFLTGSLDTAITLATGNRPKRKWTFTLGYSYTGEVQLSATAMFNRRKESVRVALWPEGAWDEARAAIAGSVLGSVDMKGNPLFKIKDYGPVSEVVEASEVVTATEAA